MSTKMSDMTSSVLSGNHIGYDCSIPEDALSSRITESKNIYNYNKSAMTDRKMTQNIKQQNNVILQKKKLAAKFSASKWVS